MDVWMAVNNERLTCVCGLLCGCSAGSSAGVQLALLAGPRCIVAASWRRVFFRSSHGIVTKTSPMAAVGDGWVCFFTPEGGGAGPSCSFRGGVFAPSVAAAAAHLIAPPPSPEKTRRLCRPRPACCRRRMTPGDGTAEGQKRRPPERRLRALKTSFYKNSLVKQLKSMVEERCRNNEELSSAFRISSKSIQIYISKR